MQLTIHRGTQEIGGSCVEVSTDTTRIIIDVGLPLVDQDREPFDRAVMKGKSLDQLVEAKVVPNVPGLFTNGDSRPKAILLSHAHLDHVGLLEHTPDDIPVYATSGTSKMMLAGGVFAGQKSLDRDRHFEIRSRTPFVVGDIKITPYAVDHSCFGAVAFLVEADGRKLLYSGDLRWHGRKPGMIKSLVEEVGPMKIDALVMEGTHFGSKRPPRKTEYQLEEDILEQIISAPGLVLASFSPIDVDRLVTYLKASMRSGRTFVADAYTAFVMHLVHKEIGLPDSKSTDCMKVYFNLHFERRSVQKLKNMFADNQIALADIVANPTRHVLCFRPSNLRLDFKDQLPDRARVLYSYWQGYLEKSDWVSVQQRIKKVRGDFRSCHTSGHIYLEDIEAFVKSIAPKVIIPVHTFEASLFTNHIQKSFELDDGFAVNVAEIVMRVEQTN